MVVKGGNLREDILARVVQTKKGETGVVQRGGHDPPQEVSPAAQGRQTFHHWTVLWKATDEVWYQDILRRPVHENKRQEASKCLPNSMNMGRYTTMT